LLREIGKQRSEITFALAKKNRFRDYFIPKILNFAVGNKIGQGGAAGKQTTGCKQIYYKTTIDDRVAPVTRQEHETISNLVIPDKGSPNHQDGFNSSLD